MDLRVSTSGIIEEDLNKFRTQIDDLYMEMMVKALAKVSYKYISYGSSFHVERTFLCEFYHQWSLLLKENNPEKLCLNGEPCKNVDGKLKYPDLILHDSQRNNENNRVACELKRCKWGKPGVKKDMKTLNLMLTGAGINKKLTQNFKQGVFIQIGGTIDRLKDYVKQSSFNEDIWCIVVDDNVLQLTVERIGEMKKK